MSLITDFSLLNEPSANKILIQAANDVSQLKNSHAHKSLQQSWDKLNRSFQGWVLFLRGIEINPSIDPQPTYDRNLKNIRHNSRIQFWKYSIKSLHRVIANSIYEEYFLEVVKISSAISNFPEDIWYFLRFLSSQILHLGSKNARKGRETYTLQVSWRFLPTPRSSFANCWRGCRVPINGKVSKPCSSCFSERKEPCSPSIVTLKSASALSRFLTVYTWSLRLLMRLKRKLPGARSEPTKSSFRPQNCEYSCYSARWF